MRRGAEVTVSATAYRGYERTGTIDVIDPNLDPKTRSIRVIARVDNPDGRFLPGMSAGVVAVLGARASAVTIPAEAVFAEGDQFLAYVVQEDSTVARAPLKLGTRLAGSVEVLDGLSEGDRVVRAGHQKLFPGAKVIPVNASREGGPAAEAGGAPAAGDAAAQGSDAASAEDDDAAAAAPAEGEESAS
jgi:membrane fusion protein (multidrug efflux system)